MVQPGDPSTNLGRHRCSRCWYRGADAEDFHSQFANCAFFFLVRPLLQQIEDGSRGHKSRLLYTAVALSAFALMPCQFYGVSGSWAPPQATLAPLSCLSATTVGNYRTMGNDLGGSIAYRQINLDE